MFFQQFFLPPTKTIPDTYTTQEIMELNWGLCVQCFLLLGTLQAKRSRYSASPQSKVRSVAQRSFMFFTGNAAQPTGSDTLCFGSGITASFPESSTGEIGWGDVFVCVCVCVCVAVCVHACACVCFPV